MQSAVSDPKLRVGSSGKLSERVVSRTAVNPPFVHRRGRKPTNLSWSFKLAAAGAVCTLIAISLLLQALI